MYLLSTHYNFSACASPIDQRHSFESAVVHFIEAPQRLDSAVLSAQRGTFRQRSSVESAIFKSNSERRALVEPIRIPEHLRATLHSAKRFLPIEFGTHQHNQPRGFIRGPRSIELGGDA